MNLQERVLLKKANRDELYCLEPPFPTTNFLIETSNACNHACIFCAHQKMKRKIGKINTEFVFDYLSRRMTWVQEKSDSMQPESRFW